MSIQNTKIHDGIVVVSAKEHGKIYKLEKGELSYLEHVEEHPPTYSDNEGFFVRSGEGARYGSGNPREEDDEQNLTRYINAITSELSDVIKEVQPQHIYLVEPEHLSGLITEHLKRPDSVQIETVAHGNFVNHSLVEIAALLEEFKNESLDPSDPASVAGEENAEEKRKILEVAQMRHS